MTHLPPTSAEADRDARSDAELITAVRGGDNRAYAVLWSRHERAAHNLARQVGRASDADELVSESFLRVLRAITGGGGPESAFRPYLLSTLRRVNLDVGRSYYQRITLTDDDADLEPMDSADSAADVALDQDEQSAAWRAWSSLPESSRTLLWHLIIEEESPAQIAPLLGTSANGVSSRAVRARERLLQAFLQQHVRSADNEECRWTRERIGEYVRRALSNRDHATVERHLDDCERCRAAMFEIADVNQTLRGVVAPIVLGGPLVGAGYLKAVAAGHGLPHVGFVRLLKKPVVVVATVLTACGVAAAGAYALAGRGSPPAAKPQVVVAADNRSAPSVTPPAASPIASLPAVKPTSTTVAASPPRPSLPSPSLPSPTVPSPSPTRASTSPTPTTSVSPTGAPKPSPPVRVTRTVNVTVTASSLFGTDGELVASVPTGWTVTGATGPAKATCTVTGSSIARCRLRSVLPGSFAFTFTAAGPSGQLPQPTMHVVYTDAGGTSDHDYPL